MDGLPSQNTNLFYNNGGWQYCVNIYDVQPGDIVEFDWDTPMDGVSDHVGISTSSFDGYGFSTIEGNVGNAVQEKYRDMSHVAYVMRPPYE